MRPLASRRSTLSALARATLAFALALTLLPVAGSTARAQTGGDGTGKGSEGKARTLSGARPATHGFVLYSADGGTSCRIATPEQMRTLFAQGKARGLRQINHLEDEPNTNTPGTGGDPDGQTNLIIILRATGQLDLNPTARDAFIRAAERWEERILSPITVIIDVDFGPQFFGQDFEDGVIGATQGQDLQFPDNYANVRESLRASPSSAQEQSLYNALPTGSVPTDLATGSVNDVSAASPILRAIGEVGAHAETNIENDFFGPAPKIGFNSDFNFDFNPDNGVTGNQIDFDGVATHEIGHVLGFNSDVGVQEIAPPGTTPSLSVWDFFRFNTPTIFNFTTQQRTLRTTSGNHFEFNGNTSRHQLSTGNPEGDGGDGNQASHWKDALPNAAIGVMDPIIANGERSTITDNDLRALDAMGYRVVLLDGTQPELPLPPAPDHDNIANAKVLFGNSGINASESFSSRFATSESGEPGLTFNYGPGNSPLLFPARKSVWYKWTATASGPAVIHTNGSNYDTVLAVYTGAPGSLTFVQSNDDQANGILTSSIQFTATAGTAYFFYFDGFLGAGGNATFNWQLPGASGAGAGSVGLYNPSSGAFFLRNTNTTGAADITFFYGPAGAGWTPLSGDWNGDGVDTIGLYNPGAGSFFLRNSNSQGAADITFFYGPAGAGWVPLSGDWNGDGVDTIGLYNPAQSAFYLRNSNSQGVADVTFFYGPTGAGWVPLVGDWNGDGATTAGLYNPAQSAFFLRNTNTTGAADITFFYGPAGAGWTPLSGDWNGL